ncbi:hypothetical protein Unana1_04210 [Umbelopsis nana]
MRTAVALVAFFVATVTAQTAPYYITSPIQGTTYKAGQSAEIDWLNGNSESITISLLNGPTPQTQSILSVIASNVNGADGSYTWTVPASVAVSSTYSIQIKYGGGNYSYSSPFSITGGSSTLSYSAMPSTSSLSLASASSISTAIPTVLSLAPSTAATPSASASASSAAASATKSSGAMQNLAPVWAVAIPAVAALFV